MILPQPSPGYDERNEAETRNALQQADAQNVKKTTILTSFKMRDTATGVVKIVVMTSGAFVIT